MNKESYFHVGHAIQSSHLIHYISNTQPLYYSIHGNGREKYKLDVYHLRISEGYRFLILNGDSLSAGYLIHCRQGTDYFLMLRWSISGGMRCR